MGPPRQSPRASADTWARFSEYVESAMGLYYPPERLGDLVRAMEGAAGAFGFDDAAECARWISSAHLDAERLEVLARHLTIGETYFFRDSRTFEVLSASVLPQLIQDRRGRDQRLRLWSAACASGEEPYSLAILLRDLLPDLAGWQVTILATDINATALRKAVEGTYTEWSFRGTPAGFKERYFTPAAGRRYTIRPEIRRMVTFEHLNLVHDPYPSLATGTNAMDVIFCRNALMYFSPPQIRKVAANLQHALHDGGWLAVAASEASHGLFPELETRNFPGVILYRKSTEPSATLPWPARESVPVQRPEERPRPPARPAAAARRAPSAPAPRRRTLPAADLPAVMARANAFYEAGSYGEAADLLLAFVGERVAVPQVFSLLARALANQGRLDEALAWCDRWIDGHRTDPSAHYLRGMVLLEQGQAEDARRALQKALFLRPDLTLAYFALGNLARSRGRLREAHRLFAHAMRLLERLRPDELLPESDGLTAGRLIETLAALSGPGSAA